MSELVSDQIDKFGTFTQNKNMRTATSFMQKEQESEEVDENRQEDTPKSAKFNQAEFSGIQEEEKNTNPNRKRFQSMNEAESEEIEPPILKKNKSGYNANKSGKIESQSYTFSGDEVEDAESPTIAIDQ